MRADWPHQTVSELQEREVLFVEDGNHGQYRPRRDEFGAGEYAFIRAADMHDGSVQFEEAERINDVAIARIRKGIGRGGDVVFSHKGTVGKLALTPLDAPAFVCSPQTTFWRSLNEEVLDRRFLYYFMQSKAFIDQWRARSGETDMADYVSLTAQRELRVSVPPIVEQRLIAGVLDSLDAKIRHSRALATLLEQAAAAVFNAWFVDLEPIVSKKAGARSFPSMSAAAFDSLPGSLPNLSTGAGPPGWEVRPLSSIATFLNGVAMQKFPPRNDGSDMKVLKIAELRRGTTAGASLANADVPAKYQVSDGDVIFSWSGTLEVRLWFGGPAGLNQHLFKVSPIELPTWFSYLWVRHHLPFFRSIAAGKATTMGHINRRHLDEATVIVPPDGLLVEADAQLQPLFDAHAQAMQEARKLVSVRDSLLPELFNGGAAVSDPNA